ncbi:MAG TPA: type VI secretion system tip protein TssI/VgrG [Verrucomicrobiae bacterium]
MPIKQDNRSIAIKTPLGPDVLGLRSMSIEEQLSRLFRIEAELSSENETVDLDQVVGHEVTIRINAGQNSKRFFHGFVSRMVQVAKQDQYARYRATIVPWLWFLTRTSDCRVWVAVEDPSQGKTVPDVIEALFKLRGFNNYKLSLSATYPKREFIVQYRETDFNFVSRLMEQEGIYYYFEHQDGKHTLVLADSAGAHEPFSGYANVTFNPGANPSLQEVILDWMLEKEVHPVSTALNDFDFKRPKTPLLSATNTSRKHGAATYEIYDAPGEYVDSGDGDRLAQVRLDELQSQYEQLHGQASARGLAAGSTFTLKNHPRQDQNREYLITGISLNASAGEFITRDAGKNGEFFSCNFSCIAKTQQFRPARLTPKPIVQGPQTAVIVGPSGEEIYTDQYARVKVHFRWDRHDNSDQNSSCWVRVSQYWAGKAWGAIHIPRMGQEVVVEFLEGDPDRPIITGRVYNADQTVPYALPANKTQSGIKSRSSKGGSAANFNEIRLEDKKGSEEVYIHAEKDQNNVVENDETTKVGHDRTESVGNNETITIGKDRTETVGANEKIAIGANRTETVAANESIAVTANRTRTVGGNENITVTQMRVHSVGVNEAINVGAAQAITVGAVQAITVGSNQTTNVGGSRTENVAKDETVSIGGARTVSVGKDDSLSVTKNLNITAGESITITTGSASISMKKDGTITISGKDISIEGSGAINVKASKNITMKGQKILQN